jgi:F-type H+-transporting ATPase subunit b
VGLFALAGAATGDVARLAAAEPAGGLTINFFWIIVAAANFILFYALFQAFFAKPVAKMLSDRRARIEQGLADAEAARLEREQSATERAETISQARREAKEIIDRAQKVAQETRDADIAATREELERLRTQAASDIEAEKQRALADLRAEVADLALAAAGRVVGETMSDDRQRRLVEQFIRETAEPGSGG